MAQPSCQKIADIILTRRPIYGLDTDSRIRQIADRLTAKALFELLARLDDESPDFASQVSRLFEEFGVIELTHRIGFASDVSSATDDETDNPQQPENPTEYYLKLVFRNEDAAYYQFGLFPDIETDYILGATRKRAGAVQHIRVEFSHPEALQQFIESCRDNPHFLRVEESTVDEFNRAPSNAV